MSENIELIDNVDVVNILLLLRLRARAYAEDAKAADDLVEAVLKEAIANPPECSTQSELQEWLIDRLVAQGTLKNAVRKWIMTRG